MMIYKAIMSDDKKNIKHYGVKGMKWGKHTARRIDNGDGTYLRRESNAHYYEPSSNLSDRHGRLTGSYTRYGVYQSGGGFGIRGHKTGTIEKSARLDANGVGTVTTTHRNLSGYVTSQSTVSSKDIENVARKLTGKAGETQKLAKKGKGRARSVISKIGKSKLRKSTRKAIGRKSR